MEKNNLEVWDKLKHPPKDQLTTIQGGRLKGMTDIKPQWRYQVMTEQFGVIGIGWYFEYVNKWIEDGSDNQKIAFVDINLFIKVEEEWSKPIPGTGGSLLITKEKAGLHTSDEAFKMATTDALSTAMKMIGVAADIYMGEFAGGKYKKKSEEPNGGENDFGTPDHPFGRDNIIEFGMHSKTGDGTNKKWLELSDKYLETLNKKVTGGYKKFVEKEIAFRANDKKLQDGKKETEKKTLTKEEVTAKETETKDNKASKKNEVLKKEPAEKPTPEVDEIDGKLRQKAIDEIEQMRKNGHMKPESAKSWIEKAETLNEPIAFELFRWKVYTAFTIYRANDDNLINEDTRNNYLITIKNPKTKIADLEPIIADLNEMLNKK